jgi:ERCC4-type nuclease
LKSLFLPSWTGLVKIFGSKETVVKEFSKENLKLKYDYISEPFFHDDEPNILIDTREQNALQFKDSKKMKLSCGDYTTTGPLFSDVFIERKSLEDLVSTLTAGAQRFDREISRAEDFGQYLVVLVENKVSNAINYSPENSFSKYINGKFVFFKIREICSKYKNIQFLFSDSRENSQALMIKIFKMKDKVRNYDLEFLKDFNLI